MDPPKGFQEVREHVLGWESYLDVEALSWLLPASSELAQSTRQPLLSALMQLVQEGEDLAKAAAVLSSMAPRGDSQVIRAVVKGLVFGHRRHATNALRKLADKGDPVAVEAVCGFLGHEVSAVRREALLALRFLVRRDDSAAAFGGETSPVARMAKALCDAELSVRMAATDALAATAKRGDARTTALVVEHLGHESPGVREAALIALHQIAAPDRGDAIALVAKRLEESDVEARKALLSALQQLAPPGNQQALDEVARRLTDSSIEVRKVALRVFGAIAEAPVPAEQLRLLEVSLEDSRATVRRAALGAVEKLALQSAELRDLVLKRLDDASTAVRCAAIVATGRVCDPQDEATVRKLAAFMEEPSCQVAAQQALGQLLQRGSVAPLAVLRDLLWHESLEVRESASTALDRLPQQMQWLREKWSPGKPRRMVRALLWHRHGPAR